MNCPYLSRPSDFPPVGQETPSLCQIWAWSRLDLLCLLQLFLLDDSLLEFILPDQAAFLRYVEVVSSLGSGPILILLALIISLSAWVLALHGGQDWSIWWRGQCKCSNHSQRGWRRYFTPLKNWSLRRQARRNRVVCIFLLIRGCIKFYMFLSHSIYVPCWRSL